MLILYPLLIEWVALSIIYFPSYIPNPTILNVVVALNSRLSISILTEKVATVSFLFLVLKLLSANSFAYAKLLTLFFTIKVWPVTITPLSEV